MKKKLTPFLKICLCPLGSLFASSQISLAQVTPDGTTNTTVNPNGDNFTIENGDRAGGNLFHSFSDFSVPNGGSAVFNNATDISNIFSRVTGGNISNIDGLIQANGSASLFLINPAGIIFGEGARLDLGGSFYGSSATSILFEDGEFSAADLENPPLLTVNAPIGLGFRDNPGDIVNRSTVQDSAEEVIGLEVNPGNNLTFIASNLNFEGGSLTASGGDIYLGAISESGTVGISENGSLSFAEDISRGDITLSNGSEVDVRGFGGGNIKVDVRNLNLEGGELGVSSIRAGIREESTAIEAQAGDLTIDATGNLSLNEGEIINDQEGIGNSGNVFITTGSLSLLNGGLIATRTKGQGNAGAVNVTATGDIIADGENSEGDGSGITSRVIFPDAVGNSGGVTVSTNNLYLTAGGRVDAGVGGQGNAGAVNVTATGDIIADGVISRGIPSGIASRINPDGVGDAGGVTISTNNLYLTAGGRVDASTGGQGNAGTVNVTATGDITIDGERLGDIPERLRGIPSGITSRVSPIGEGDAGGVTVSTNNLNLTNGGEVSASTSGQGNAGAVNVTATGDITIDGEGSLGIPSGITSRVDPDVVRDPEGVTVAVGDAGGVTISTNNLNLTAGGRVSASTEGQGNANNVTIEATESIMINGFIESFRSGISANALNQDGNGGDVFINTGKLSVANGGSVEATNLDNIGKQNPGTGRPGNISIAADTIELTDNARIETATQFAGGESGIIDLQVAENIILRNNSLISAQALNNADGGNINIDSRFIIAFPNQNNDIIASAQQGQGGNITINSQSLFGIEERSLNSQTNDINASSEFNLDGNVTINTLDINRVQGVTELPTNIVVPEQTTVQACNANREAAAKNNFTIAGKGGITPAPELPLDSHNISINGETNSASTIPQAIETSKGKIQPARGVKVTESGEIILTAYRTSNSGDRLPEKRNCG